MASVVRNSKYRHVFGTPLKDEFCFKDLRVSTSAWDSNYIEANAKYFAIGWKAGGGGSLAILKHNQCGKIGADVPLLTGHTAQILDFRFHPFNENLIASGSEDATVKIWSIPEGGLTENVTKAEVTLQGHARKVCGVEFNPVANNILATTAFDYKIKIWDIETAVDKYTIEGPKDAIQSMSWDRTGSTFAATSKDKTFRIVDPRASAVVAETSGHQGTKGSRVVWMRNKDLLFTVGFSKISERQFMIWDPRNFTAPLFTSDIDICSGMLMPFYDEDTNIMFLGGKGDGNIRYYEMVDKEPYAHFLTQYSSNTPQNGLALLPKYACDTSSCEIARMYKLEPTQVTPLTFTVPRKESSFQEDIYPDTVAPEAALSAEEWCSGQNSEPRMMSMRNAKEFASTPKMSEFKPKVVEKPQQQVQSSSNDPKALAKQNEELQAQVAQLEKENAELRAKLAELGVN